LKEKRAKTHNAQTSSKNVTKFVPSSFFCKISHFIIYKGTIRPILPKQQGKNAENGGEEQICLQNGSFL
jgi:hypothetical protein